MMEGAHMGPRRRIATPNTEWRSEE